MWVKDIETREVVDLSVEQIKLWPGRYVAAAAPKSKQAVRSGSSVSASSEASKKENTHGS